MSTPKDTTEDRRRVALIWRGVGLTFAITTVVWGGTQYLDIDALGSPVFGPVGMALSTAGLVAYSLGHSKDVVPASKTYLLVYVLSGLPLFVLFFLQLGAGASSSGGGRAEWTNFPLMLLHLASALWGAPLIAIGAGLLLRQFVRDWKALRAAGRG